MIEFEIISDIIGAETIASGTGVHIRKYLQKIYGKGRWKKMKGFAKVKMDTDQIFDAEIHWFEAHGIGRKDFKIKRFL